jgi:hypothetical protein
MKKTYLGLVGSTLLLLASCSDRSMTLDDESDALGLNGGDPPLQETPWGCLSQEKEPLPYAADPSLPITYVLHIGSVLAPNVMPPELDIRLCALNDVFCSAPQTPSITMPVSGRPDVLGLELPYGFEGHLLLIAPGYVPTAYYFLGPMIGGADGSSFVVGESILLYDAPTLDEQLNLLLGDQLVREGGLLTVRAIDCLGQLSDGVRVELLGTDAQAWVELNGLMVRNDDGSLTTDTSGIAGFVNLPASATIVEGVAPDDCDASDTSDGACLAAQRYGRMAVRVQPGVMTIAELRPDYRFGR